MKRILFVALLIAALGGSLCAQTPPGGYTSPAGGGSSSSSGSGTGFPNAISPTASGVKADVKMCRDTNVHLNSTTTVQCDTATFTSADVGKVIFGTCCGLNGGANHAASVLQLPQGTIVSITDATHVVVSIAATATSSQSGQLLLWGSDDSTAWDTTWTAATGTAGACKPIVMPGSLTFISTAKFLTTTCNTGITGSGSQGASITGLGYKTSMFVVLPNFVAAGCTGATLSSLGAVDCFGPSIGFQFANFGIWGGEFGNQASLNGKVFLNVGIDSYLTNVLLAGLASCTPATCTMVGVNFDTSGQTASTMVVDGFGAGSGGTTGMCTVSGGSYNNWVQSFCGNTNGIGLKVVAGARLTALNGGWGGSKTSSTLADVVNDGFFTDRDGVFFGCTSACANLVVDNGSTTKLDGSNLIGGGAAGSFALFFNSAATAKVYAHNTFLTGGAANGDVSFATSMGFFNDQGGNTYAHANTAILPTCAATTGGTACITTPGSTNEKGTIRITASAVATGTVTLTFAGAGLSGGTATTPDCTFNYANTGTGAWSLLLTTPIVLITRSSTVPVINWNQTGALTAASTYDIDYVCVNR